MTFSLGSTPRSLVKYNDQSISAITEVGSGAGLTDDMVLIRELTASSSATLDFVDGADDVVLDNTYPTYLFKFISIHPSASSYLAYNTSVDGGSNYADTKTATFFIAYNGESASPNLHVDGADNRDIAQSTGDVHLTPSVGTDNDQSCSGHLWLYNPSSTTYVKNFMAIVNTYTGDDYSQEVFSAGYSNTTSAVDAVRFKMSSGNIDTGTIKLYGLKDS